MLIQSLNSHPHISADYEVFLALDGRSESEVLGMTFAKQPFYIKAKGFKIFYYHPLDGSSRIWDMLSALKEIHVIHLKRRNILHTIISSKIAHMTDVYGVRTKREEQNFKKKIRPFLLDPGQLQKELKQTLDWQIAGAKRFESHPMLDTYYEDLVVQPDQEFRRVVEFLGVEYRPLRTDFRKQRTNSLRQLITNYDELKVFFEKTEWGSMFDA